MKELNNVIFFDYYCPLVSWQVDERAEEFEKKVGVLAGLISKLNVLRHVFFECFQGSWVKLRNIPAHFEEKSVAELESTLDQLGSLAILRHDLSVASISREIHCQGDELFADDGLGTMDYQLEAERDALSISKCCLELVFLRKMVQDL